MSMDILMCQDLQKVFICEHFNCQKQGVLLLLYFYWKPYSFHHTHARAHTHTHTHTQTCACTHTEYSCTVLAYHSNPTRKKGHLTWPATHNVVSQEMNLSFIYENLHLKQEPYH